MKNPIGFTKEASKFIRNPLGIIGLFVSMIYGVACLVLGFSLNGLNGYWERLPIIYLVAVFPILLLAAFVYLVIKHNEKLFGPQDYKDEKNFLILSQKIPLEKIEAVKDKLESIKTNNPGNAELGASIEDVARSLEEIGEYIEKVPINNLWKLNHWGGSCARLENGVMIFEGTNMPKDADGSHINLLDSLEVGKKYEISCFAKATSGTSGMFQLWCHDNTGINPHGSHVATSFKSPPKEGERFKVVFEASYNKSVRIHLQYKPGTGRVEVSDVKIVEIK